MSDILALLQTSPIMYPYTKLSHKSEEQKKLSMYNLWPHTSIIPVRSVTAAWVALTSFAMHCQPFQNIPSCHVPSWITQFKNCNVKMLVFFRNVLLENNSAFEKNNDFVHYQMLRWTVIFYTSNADHFKHILHSPVCHNFHHSYKFLSYCPQSVGSKEFVRIYLVL